MNDYNYHVHSTQVFSPRDPEIIAERFLRTIDDFGRIDTLPGAWTVGSSRTGWKIDENGDVPWEDVPIEEARARMGALVRENVKRDDYLQPDPDSGYTLIVSNNQLGAPTSICLTLSAGAVKPLDNGWSVSTGSFPTLADDSILTYPIFRPLFLTLISNWPCSWACVRGSKNKWKKVPGVIGTTSVPTFSHTINWMGYLSADESRGLEPPGELISERTPDGGLLMISSEHKPDPADAEDMRRSQILGELMDLHYRDEWWPGGPSGKPKQWHNHSLQSDL